MAVNSNTNLPLGTPAPAFSLVDVVAGKHFSLNDFTNANALVIMFICRHCPYVVHVRNEILRLANDYMQKNVAFIAISSNDSTQYPEDAPEGLKEMALEYHFPFPLLFDESQQVARDYCAACTPDFYIFDSKQKLAYRGRLDDSTPGNGLPLTGTDFRKALDAILSGQPAPPPQLPSMGCSIKWKA